MATKCYKGVRKISMNILCGRRFFGRPFETALGCPVLVCKDVVSVKFLAGRERVSLTQRDESGPVKGLGLKMETTIVYWGFIGIMEKKMETTILRSHYFGK